MRFARRGTMPVMTSAPQRTVNKRLGREFSMTMFREAAELDRDLLQDEHLTRWLFADALHARGERREMSFYDYVGPHHVRRYMRWIDRFPYRDWFPDQVAPLAAISEQRDRAVLEALGVDPKETLFEPIGRYNAEDYLLQRFYPVPDRMKPRTILDFGAGHGRQANLAFHEGDDVTETMIAIDGIPGSYLTQRAYYAALGLRCADYIEARTRGHDFDVAERSVDHDVIHLPTWRFDLVPDESVDLALLVQVIKELPRRLVVHVLQEFARVVKPGGAVYVRDHLQGHHPNHMPIDQLMMANGFVLEFAPAVQDRVEIHGLPRIWRKLDPALYFEPELT